MAAEDLTTAAANLRTSVGSSYTLHEFEQRLQRVQLFQQEVEAMLLIAQRERNEAVAPGRRGAPGRGAGPGRRSGGGRGEGGPSRRRTWDPGPGRLPRGRNTAPGGGGGEVAPGGAAGLWTE